MGALSRSRLFAVAIAVAAWSSTARAGVVADGIVLDQAGDVTAQLVFSKAGFRDAVRIYKNGTLLSLPACGFMQKQGGGAPLASCVFENTECVTGANPCPPLSSGELNCACKTALQIDLGNMVAGDKLTFELYADSTAPTPDGIPEYIWNSDVTKNTDNPFSHVRISNIYGNTYLTEFEDLPQAVSDQDYNDMVMVVQVAPSCPPSQPGCTNTAFVTPVPGGPQDLRSVTNVAVQAGAGAGDATRSITFHTKLYNFDAVSQQIGYCATQTIPGTVTNPGDSGATETVQGYNYTNHSLNSVVATDGGPTCYITDTEAPTVSFSQETAPPPANFCDLATGAGESAGPTGDLYNLQAATSPNNPTIVDITTVMTVSQIDQAITTPENKLTPKSSAAIRQAMINATNPVAQGVSAMLFFGFDPAISSGAQRFSCPRGGNTELLLSGASAGTAGNLGGGANGPVFAHYAPKTQTYPAAVAINSPATVTIPTNPVEARGTAGIFSTIDYTWTDNRPDLEPGKPHLIGHITQVPVELGGEFYAGGSGVKSVQTTLAFSSALPEGFEGTLTAVLHSVYEGTIFQISTFHFSKDHAPPTVDAFHTERHQNGIDITGTVEDQTSGVGQVDLSPTVNASTRASVQMSYVSGDFSNATSYRASLAAAATDVVGLTAVADDTHFNATTVTLPVAATGGDRQVECNNTTGAQVTLDGSASTGPGGTSYLWTGPFGSAGGVTVSEALPFGASTVALSLTAPGGNLTGGETSTITVGDATPPAFTVSVTPSCIWPANHKLVLFTLGADITYSVSDVCDPTPSVQIVAVSDTDGILAPFGAHHACLRASRAGGDTSGNVYRVTVRATDAHGNATDRDVLVTVPHDQSAGCPNTPPSMVVSDGDPRCTQ